MKKVITAVVAILIVGGFAASAYAWRCGGGQGSPNYNRSANNDVNYQSFLNDTQALRTSISADRAELNALMMGTNPDPARARVLSEKISKQENELRKKANGHGMSNMGGMGNGRGWHSGTSGYNQNLPGCW
ncbi:MAG: zinc resistance protein [Desulfobacteraceae bacterium]|nr:zinc resistance protein [Desulfobacteraceae bacterium]